MPLSIGSASRCFCLECSTHHTTGYIPPPHTHILKSDFRFLLRDQQTYHIAPGFSCGNNHLIPPTHFTFRWALLPVHCISLDYVSQPTWRLSLLFNRTSLHFSIPIKTMKTKDPSALRKIKESIFLHETKATSTCLISKPQPVHSFKSPACPLTQMIAKMPFQPMISGCAGHWQKIRVKESLCNRLVVPRGRRLGEEWSRRLG